MILFVEGALADLLLVDGDPIANIRLIEYQTYRRLREERSPHDEARENLQDMAGPERSGGDRTMSSIATRRLPGGVGEVAHASPSNVRSWHLADIDVDAEHVRSQG